MKRRNFLKILGIGGTGPLIPAGTAKAMDDLQKFVSKTGASLPDKDKATIKYIPETDYSETPPITAKLFDGQYSYWEVTENQDIIASMSGAPVHGFITRKLSFTTYGLAEDLEIGSERIFHLEDKSRNYNEKFLVLITSVTRTLNVDRFPTTDVHGIILKDAI